MTELHSIDHKLDRSNQVYGDLRESNDLLDDPEALEARFDQDGYCLFRDLIDRNTVLDARREILLEDATIVEIDAIDHPLMEGIYSDDSCIDKVNLFAFAELSDRIIYQA